jgi:hypothetical protein
LREALGAAGTNPDSQQTWRERSTRTGLIASD